MIKAPKWVEALRTKVDAGRVQCDRCRRVKATRVFSYETVEERGKVQALALCGPCFKEIVGPVVPDILDADIPPAS